MKQMIAFRMLPLVLLFFSLKGFSQSKTLPGVVRGTENEPLSNVSILVKSSGKTFITDALGAFSVKTANRDTLLFTIVGYEEKEIFVKPADRRVVVAMEPSSNSLDEVVVVGYGTQRRSDLTGALSGIKADEIEKSRNPDLLTSLQGKVPGARIFLQSGEPGAAVNIQIRGASSLFGSSSPLFVIDGIPFDMNQEEVASSDNANLGYATNPLASMNPADIESMEVLKDASATAIYGSRGANGVVIITTKSGKKGRSQVTYDGYVSVSTPTKLLDMLDANTFIDYQRLVNPISSLFYNTDSLGSLDQNDPRDPYALTQHDWQDEMLAPAITQNHTVTMSAGNERTTFSGGLGYLNEEGIVRTTTQKRYTLRLRVDHQAGKRVKMGINTNTSFSELGGATNTGQANAWNGMIQSLVQSKPIDYFDSDFDETIGYVTPISTIENAYRNISLMKGIGNAYIEAEILKDLKLNVSAGGILSSSKGKEFYSRLTRIGNANNGVGVLQEKRSYTWYNTNRLTYDKRFSSNHRLNAMAAYEVNGYNFENFLIRNFDYADEVTGVDDISKGATIGRINSGRWVNNRLSLLGRVNYTMFNRYLFTASMRRDGSDKFGPGNKFAYFPSFAFAWRVSEESFLANHPLINNLKLRTSYGRTGNERIPAYSYLGRMSNSYYSTGGVPVFGLSPETLANPDLKWEATEQYNAGIDLSLLNNRVTFTADAYLKDTKDMLLPVLIPSQSGYDEQWQNIGRMENMGLEFLLTTENIRNKNFQWSTNFNISANRNRIKSLGTLDYIPVVMDNGVISNLGRVSVGQPLGTAYGYRQNGIYQIDQFTWQNDSDPDIAHADRNYELKEKEVAVAGVNVRPGSIRFHDLNGDGIVDDDNDRTFISNSQPKHFGGFGNTLTYKNLELNVFMEWSYGAEIFNLGKIVYEGLGINNNITKSFWNERWTPDNPTNDYPDFRNGSGLVGGNNTFRMSSSYYVEDASYLRLRNVSLSYDIPRNLLVKSGITALKVYFTGNNLLTLTNYSGYDPDISFADPLLPGLDRISYPRAKSFIMGLNISF